MKNLRELNVMGNSDMHSLPKSLCEAQRLNSIKVCSTNFVYPPSQVVEEGTEFIMKYICEGRYLYHSYSTYKFFMACRYRFYICSSRFLRR